MKTKFTFFVASFLLVATTKAQNYNSAELVFNLSTVNPSQTIVRTWDDKYVVSFFREPSGSRFICSDFTDFLGTQGTGFPSSALYSGLFPSNYVVLDFRILDDYLFFCGTTTASGREGFVGFFDLNDFFSGSIFPQFYIISDASTLNKMTVYPVGSNYKIVAIGYDNQTIPDGLIMEVDNITDPLTINFTQHLLQSYSGYYEHLDDVFYTGNSVVFVGKIEYSNNYTFHLRIMNNPANLTSSLHYNDVFFYPATSFEINSRTRSTLMDDGNIAIAYVHPDTGYPTFFRTRIRIINVNSNIPYNTFSQEFDIDGKMEPVEMVYSSFTQKLVLLQPIDYTYNTHPQFIFLNSFATSSYSTTYTYFLHDFPYLSLDIYNENNIVSVGENKTYLQAIMPSGSVGCPYKPSANIYTTANVALPMMTLRLRSSSTSPVFFPFPQSIFPGNWPRNCYTY